MIFIASGFIPECLLQLISSSPRPFLHFRAVEHPQERQVLGEESHQEVRQSQLGNEQDAQVRIVQENHLSSF